MSRVSKYVSQVVKLLPDPRRERVREELTHLLDARKAELEKRLGHKPGEAEIDRMLADYGAPQDVARRFTITNPEGSIELVERYLAAVERRLPRDVVSADITAELREALESKVEAREAELDRTLTFEEMSGILKAFGNPDFVAYRYHKRPYLIGPELAPYFWTAQRVAIGLVLALTLVGAVVRNLGTEKPVSTVLRGVGALWDNGIFMFGAVTIVFLLMDRFGAPNWGKAGHPSGWWNPRMLPAAYVRAPKTLFESLFALVFDGIFILWWVGVVHFPNSWGADNGQVELHLSQSWEVVWWPILAIAVAQAAVHLADVVHPGWSRLRAVAAIAGCAVGIAIVSYLFSTGDLIEATVAPGHDRTGPEVERLLGMILRPLLFIAAAVWAIEIAVEVSRLVRSRSAKGGLKPA